MSINVVDTILRVILHDEDRHVLPENRVSETVDDLAEREVVVRHARLRCAPVRGGPLRVVARQDHHHQVRHRLALFPFSQVKQDVPGLHDIGRFLRPAGILLDQHAIERGNVGMRLVALLEQLTLECVVVRPLIVLLEHRRPARGGLRIALR